MFSRFKKPYKTLNCIQVSESALRHNLNVFRNTLPSQNICPVLKGNAYGHGLELVAKAIVKEKPAFLVVDSFYEANRIRRSGVKWPTLILGYSFPENLRRKMPYEFAVGDLETSRRLASLGLPAHIEIDTGMNRMGFGMDKLAENLHAMKEMDLNVTGLFTHFADADNPDPSFTKKQEALFRTAIKQVSSSGFKPKWFHASNSAGALKSTIPELNMARLGFCLYGQNVYKKGDPLYEKLTALKPAMKLMSHLVAVRKLKKGDRVSYNCTFTTEKDMTIGVIPFGYYEGIPRALSNKSPFIGRICMNHSIMKVDSNANIGDEIMLYQNLAQLADAAQTIPYELFCRLNETIRRELVK
jgi:alanine racemase